MTVTLPYLDDVFRCEICKCCFSAGDSDDGVTFSAKIGSCFLGTNAVGLCCAVGKIFIGCHSQTMRISGLQSGRQIGVCCVGFRLSEKTTLDHRSHCILCTMGCALRGYAAELALYRQGRQAIWSACLRRSAIWFCCNGIFCDRFFETNQKTKTNSLGAFNSCPPGNIRRIGVVVLTRRLNVCYCI